MDILVEKWIAFVGLNGIYERVTEKNLGNVSSNSKDVFALSDMGITGEK